MTDLSKLYAAIEGRTRGPWKLKEMAPEWDGDATYEIDIDGRMDCVTDLRYYNSAPNRIEDARFIALMGTCADELAAVLRAAKPACNVYADDHPERLDALFDAIITLETKLNGGAG